jgi:hypothetical protein
MLDAQAGLTWRSDVFRWNETSHGMAAQECEVSQINKSTSPGKPRTLAWVSSQTTFGPWPLRGGSRRMAFIQLNALEVYLLPTTGRRPTATKYTVKELGTARSLTRKVLQLDGMRVFSKIHVATFNKSISLAELTPTSFPEKK